MCATRAVIALISGAVPHLDMDSQLFVLQIHHLKPLTPPRTENKEEPTQSMSNTNGSMCLPSSQTESIARSVSAF